MGQTVLKCSRTTIEKMKNFYRPYLQVKKPGASAFFAKVPGCAVTAYQSGKVLFQGKSAEEEAGQWQGNQPKTKSTKKTPQKTAWSPPENVGSLSVIGSDEVGTGDYFGPITVAAVFISSEQIEELQKVGLKDSKLLNDRQIYDLAETIKPKVTYKLLTLPNPKYNELRDKEGMTQGKMKAMLHNQALRNVIRRLDETPYDGILIDQFAAPELYYKYLKGQPEIVKERAWFQTKAEGIHLSVAAASIIARQAFVDEMDRLSEEAGCELPKGAGAHVDEAAARLIREKGVGYLRQVAKFHFANTERATQLAERD
ncbi:MAG TPA: ribonuclease HIII [Bacillales bacterium]|nr:ribonuclease HIII [Bacillales bacterium]